MPDPRRGQIRPHACFPGAPPTLLSPPLSGPQLPTLQPRLLHEVSPRSSHCPRPAPGFRQLPPWPRLPPRPSTRAFLHPGLFLSCCLASMELPGERVSAPAASSSSGDRSQVTVSRELLTAGSSGSRGEQRRRDPWAGGAGDSAGPGTLRRAGYCGGQGCLGHRGAPGDRGCFGRRGTVEPGAPGPGMSKAGALRARDSGAGALRGTRDAWETGTLRGTGNVSGDGDAPEAVVLRSPGFRGRGCLGGRGAAGRRRCLGAREAMGPGLLRSPGY